MRKHIFIGCIALFAGIGLIFGAVEGSLGLAILFGLKLAVVGMALGALFSIFGRKSKSSKQKRPDRDVEDQEEWERLGRMGSHDTSPEEVSANAWRDKGHAPLANPEDYDPQA